jgi:hypothetical protein
MGVDDIKVSVQICREADLTEEMTTGQEKSCSSYRTTMFVESDVEKCTKKQTPSNACPFDFIEFVGLLI